MSQVQHSEPTIAKVNNIEIVFDTFGDPNKSPILLIMGLGAQMIDWKDDFCERLASRDYWVIRYDNRDTGLSTKFDINENLSFIPCIYQQITMDDSVSRRKDITYCILTMKYKF